MDSEDRRASNPFTQVEGYAVLDPSGAEVGRVHDTVYEAVSDVLKYVVVNGRAVPAEKVEVDVEAERATVPYDAATIGSAPEIEDPSGAYDAALREHYEGRGPA